MAPPFGGSLRRCQCGLPYREPSLPFPPRLAMEGGSWEPPIGGGTSEGGMAMWRWLLVGGVVLAVAACGDESASTEGPDSSASASSVSSTLADTVSGETAASTSVDVPKVESLPMCREVDRPTAPEDWYADSPVYVGDEMPIEEVRRFAAGFVGYQNIWIDPRHNGWISVGFVDGDVAAYQTALEEEFPGVGVVAVELPYSHAQLDVIQGRIRAALPRDMNASMSEVRGVVAVWVGRLTPERIAIVDEIAGDDPVCLEGLDPVATPEAGPQQADGEGWVYLAVLDSMVAQRPTIAADTDSFGQLWEEFLGLLWERPGVDMTRCRQPGNPRRCAC